jgi:hypothetical protein
VNMAATCAAVCAPLRAHSRCVPWLMGVVPPGRGAPEGRSQGELHGHGGRWHQRHRSRHHHQLGGVAQTCACWTSSNPFQSLLHKERSTSSTLPAPTLLIYETIFPPHTYCGIHSISKMISSALKNLSLIYTLTLTKKFSPNSTDPLI